MSVTWVTSLYWVIAKDCYCFTCPLDVGLRSGLYDPLRSRRMVLS